MKSTRRESRCRALTLCAFAACIALAQGCVVIGGEAFERPEPTVRPRFAPYTYEVINTLRPSSGELGHVLINTLKESGQFSALTFSQACERCIKVTLERFPDNAYLADGIVRRPGTTIFSAATRFIFWRTLCMFPLLRNEERVVTFEIREKGRTRKILQYSADHWVARSLAFLPFESRREIPLDALARIAYEFMDDAAREGMLTPETSTGENP